jgi:hypothetical protein
MPSETPDSPATLPGQFTLSRYSGGGSDRDERRIVIRLEDERSRCHVVEILMTPHELGMALTGMGNVPCEFRYFPGAPVGKYHQHKTETVVVRGCTGPGNPGWVRKADEAIRALEVDGWKGSRSNVTNTHYLGDQAPGGRELRVGYDRWVDEPPAGEDPPC